MFNRRIAAVLIGGLLFAPVPAAMAQTVAVAYASAEVPRNYVVFFEEGASRLSSSASDIVRHAAVSASGGTTVRLAGRPDRVEAVKRQLIRDGVPAGSIVVVGQRDKPLPLTGDGLPDPSRRSVEIKL
jgi:OmpA-OmpF porin, OOP family